MASSYSRYEPPMIPESDLARFRKAQMGERTGFGKSIAVIVVDMTRAFVEDRFPLGYSATGKPAAAAIHRLLDVARPMGIPIFFTRWGTQWPTDTERGRWIDKGNGTALREPDEAHTIVDELTPLPGEVVIEKAKPSGFFGTQLASMLMYLGVDTVVVTGMVTSGCVRATVVDAFSYNLKVIVPIECSADRGEVSHQASLFDIDQKYGDVLPLEAVLAELAQRQAPALAR